MSETLNRVSADEAASLLATGTTYVDVRTEEEFALGHVPGALNVPFKIADGDTLVENAQFAAVVSAAFARDEPLLIGCRSGNRSLHAAELLLSLGFSNLVELRDGFVGRADHFGQKIPGWQEQGRPVETTATVAQTYAGVRSRTARCD